MSKRVHELAKELDKTNKEILAFLSEKSIEVKSHMSMLTEEQEGMVRHGAKLLFAYAEADTVKLAVILRKAYGGAYICMGSKALGMDAVYAWPGAEIAVMGAECAIPILHKRKLAGMDEEEKQEFIKERTEEYRENLKADVENAVRYGYIDGWLEPDHTREQLIRDLEYYGKRRKTGKRKRKYGLVPL